MEDLYPDPHWNFVFGQASLRDRVGVFSFARYDPAFYGESRGSQCRQLLLWRSAKVLVHRLKQFYRNVGFVFEQDWVTRRLKKIEDSNHGQD